MADKTFSLEEVLKSGSLVLMDSSAGRTPHELCGGWYAREVFDAESFYEIGTDGLKLKLKEAQIGYDISMFHKTRTVPEVPSEIGSFVRILQRKLSFLNEKYELGKNAEQKDIPDDFYQKSEKIKKNFEDLNLRVTQLADRTHQICLMNHLVTPEYRTIFRITGYVAAQPDVMRDINGRYPRLYVERKGGREAARKRRLRTDQRIVATAFYLAAYHGEQVRVVTGDSHIGRLVRGMKKIIKISPNFRDIKTRVAGNCPQVYFSVTGLELVREA